jgi:hypothetical protein
MSLPPDSLQSLLTAPAADAWASIREQMISVWQPDYEAGAELSQARQREDNLASLELLLSHSIWPLWQSFSAFVPRAAQALADFWASHPGGRAVLMLDSLSLRELPLLTVAARARNFTIHRVSTFGSELPPETNTFAKALGFSSRSAMDNNGASSSAFPGAHTLSHALPWEDAAVGVPPTPGVLCWHHWPDDRLHHLDGSDGGFDKLFPELVKQLRSDAFWSFVKKLATGRRLVITSDHGYAVSGGFPNVSADQKDYLREKFSAQRFRADAVNTREWLPPLTATLATASGPVTFVTGRQKWQVPGGFPSLSHGGLTLMETFVPWVELSL